MFLFPSARLAQPLHPSLRCHFSTRLLPFSVSSPTPAVGPPASFHVSISSFFTDLLIFHSFKCWFFFFGLHKTNKRYTSLLFDFQCLIFPKAVLTKVHFLIQARTHAHTHLKGQSFSPYWLVNVPLNTHTHSRLMNSCHCSSLQSLTLLLGLRG